MSTQQTQAALTSVVSINSMTSAHNDGVDVSMSSDGGTESEVVSITTLSSSSAPTTTTTTSQNGVTGAPVHRFVNEGSDALLYGACGSYRKLDLVPDGGSGSFGEVCRGKSLGEDGTPVAIKELLQCSTVGASVSDRYMRLDFGSAAAPRIFAATDANISVTRPATTVPESGGVWLLKVDGDLIACTVDESGWFQELDLEAMLRLWPLRAGQAESPILDDELPRPSNLERLLEQRRVHLQEIQALTAAPVHQNILQLLDVVECNDGPFLRLFAITPLYQMDLLTYISSFKPSEEQAKGIFRMILNGVNALHSHGICHRDLKPDNVFLNIAPNGRTVTDLVIGDLGYLTSAQGATGLVGTCGILAPEIFVSGATLPYNGFSSDVWSLGVVLFMLLAHHDVCWQSADTGRWFHMKAANSLDSGFKLLRRGAARVPANLSAAAADLIFAMMSINTANRPTVEAIARSSWLRVEIVPVRTCQQGQEPLSHAIAA